MSQSRAARRRAGRSGPTPPDRRDPMVRIYLSLAVLVVLILGGFWIYNWQANRTHDEIAAFLHSTPSPAPTPTSKPVQLEDLKPPPGALPTGFPQPNIQKGILPDTKTGGHGQIVDNIPCETSEQVLVHVHSHIALFVNGKQVQIPGFIGMAPSGTGGCLYWLHTHGPDGIIHVEASDVTTSSGAQFTVGDFFDIWGETLSRNQVGPFKGSVTAYVNGLAYDGDLRAIPLRSHQSIVLEVGTPTVPPPNYSFPPAD